MTLIRVHGEAQYDEMISLEHLHRLVLKQIFDRDHMSKAEFHLLEDSFTKWQEYLSDSVIESTVGQEQQIELELYAVQLKMDMEGKYEKRKDMFREHGIDYLKFYKMNAPSAQDVARANAELEKWNKKNGFNENNN